MFWLNKNFGWSDRIDCCQRIDRWIGGIHASAGIRPSFETQGGRQQKIKTRVSVAHLQICSFFKKKVCCLLNIRIFFPVRNVFMESVSSDKTTYITSGTKPNWSRTSLCLKLSMVRCTVWESGYVTRQWNLLPSTPTSTKRFHSIRNIRTTIRTVLLFNWLKNESANELYKW